MNRTTTPLGTDPYTSHADLGGLSGFGQVKPEPEGVHFHADWEPRALALTLAMGATGRWNIDMSRAARETLPDYRQLSYYQIWTAGMIRLLEARGLVAADELDAGRALRPGPAPTKVLQAEAVAATLARGSPTSRTVEKPAAWSVGQRVRTRAHGVPHHSRLPAYVRGKTGVIERVHGCHVFAEAHAQDLGEQPQWLYTVAFDGQTLWGESSAPGLRVSVDAWESTLEAA